MEPPTAGRAPEFADCLEAFEAELDYIYRALLRHGVRGADAEDLAQDVLLVMWRRWRDFDASRPLRPWLAGIAFKIARRHLSRRTRYAPLGTIDPPDDAPTPEQALDSARAPALVLRTLAALPERHRSVLVMHDIDGLPVQEMASLMSVPLFTAYSRIRAARQAFAALLGVPRGRGSTKMAPTVLLTLERTPLPSEVRRRILAKARATKVESLSNEDLDLTRFSRGARSLAASAGVAAALGLLVSAWWAERAPARTHSTTAATLASSPPRPNVTRPRSHPATAEASFTSVLPLSPWREPATAVGRGLVGYWRFDDKPGDTLVRDISGHDRDCVTRGPHVRDARRDAWIDGTLGGAFLLADQRWLECTDGEPSATAPVEITVALWVKKLRSHPDRHWALVARRMGVDNKHYFFFGFAGADRTAS